MYIYTRTHTQGTLACLVFVLVLIYKMLQACTILYLFSQSVFCRLCTRTHSCMAPHQLKVQYCVLPAGVMGHAGPSLCPPYAPLSSPSGCALMFLEHAEHTCFHGSCLKRSTPGYFLVSFRSPPGGSSSKLPAVPLHLQLPPVQLFSSLSFFFFYLFSLCPFNLLCFSS